MFRKKPPRVSREAGVGYARTRRTPSTAPPKRHGLGVVGLIAGPNIAGAVSELGGACKRTISPLTRPERALGCLSAREKSELCEAGKRKSRLSGHAYSLLADCTRFFSRSNSSVTDASRGRLAVLETSAMSSG